MAILGQIRKRSFFLIVVIGMALFAFVISGVFVGSGITQGQSVGEINGEEIDYESFNLMVQQVQDAYRLDYSSAVDYAWEIGLQDMVLVQELGKLGINVGKEQLEQILSAQPELVSDPSFQNELGIFDFKKFTKFISDLKQMNPAAYNSWKMQEQDIISIAKKNIFYNLIASSVTFTDIESDLEYHLENDKVTIDYVKVSFDDIPDSLFNISNSQISNYIRKNKDDFMLDPSRVIDYIYIQDIASDLDENNVRTNLEVLRDGIVQYNDVTKLVDSIEGFKNVKNIPEFVDTYSEVPYEEIYLSREELVGEFGDILFGLDKGQTFGPYKEGSYYILSRMIDKKREEGINKVLLANIYQQIVPSNETSNQNYRTASQIEFDAKNNLILDSNTLNVLNYESLDPFDSELPGIPDSRSVIKWLYEKSTNVEDVKRFNLTQGYIIAIVKSINKEKLPEVADVYDDVKSKIIKTVKFDYLNKNYKNPSLELLVENFNVDVQRATAITQNDPVLVGAGAEPYIIGAAFALDPGEVSSLLLGNNGIYIIKSISREVAEDLSFNSAISSSMTDREIERISSIIVEVLKSNAEIIDNRSLYY